MSTNELTLTPSQSPGLVKSPLSISPSRSLGAVRRPVNTTGWREWLFTVDHKKIGIMYGCVAFTFFLIGGIEALFIRLQLALPDGRILSADKYNQMFTMHATTMIFLFAMPMAAAFANYFLPLQIGSSVADLS
jgi:cytochrome c oxidase subunit 1